MTFCSKEHEGVYLCKRSHWKKEDVGALFFILEGSTRLFSVDRFRAIDWGPDLLDGSCPALFVRLDEPQILEGFRDLWSARKVLEQKTNALKKLLKERRASS